VRKSPVKPSAVLSETDNPDSNVDISTAAAETPIFWTWRGEARPVISCLNTEEAEPPLPLSLAIRLQRGVAVLLAISLG